MPSDFQFITFGQVDQMRNDTTISQIRRHAMRSVGASRRLPNSRRSKQRKLLLGPTQDPEELHAPPMPDVPAVHAGPEDLTIGTATPDANAGDEAGVTSIEGADALQNPAVRALSCKTDPFGSASIAMDSTAHTLIQYYTYHSHENGNWVYETGSLPHDPGLFRQHVAQKANLAFHDELTMFCLLTATAARMRNRDNVRTVSIQQHKHLSMYKALQMLQKRIDGVPHATMQSTTQLIHCIAFLACAESYEKGWSAALAHRTAIAILVRTMGGIANIDNEYTRGQVISFDVLLSCQTLQPCLLHCDYDPGALCGNSALREWKCSVPLNEHPWGAGLLETADRNVSASLKILVRRLAEIQDVRARLKIAPAGPTTAKARDWVCLRTAATRVSLLAFPSADPNTEALRIALIMYTLLPDHDLTRAWIVKDLARRLRQALSICSMDDWHDCNDVKLWVLLMGYFCAQYSAEEKNWFFATVLQAWSGMGESLSASSTRTTTLDKLLEFQHRFFFHEAIQRPLTEGLARCLLS